MVADKISDVYAKALLELAQSAGKIEEIESELKELNKILMSDSDVWNFFKSPLLGLDEKKRILDVSFKKSINKVLYNFLGVLADRRRFEYFAEILESYSNHANELLGRTKVIVRSAVEMEEKQLDSLKNELERFLGKKVVFDYAVQQELLGGLLVKSGDLMMDTSVKSNLETIRNGLLGKKILGEGYYEN